MYTEVHTSIDGSPYPVENPQPSRQTSFRGDDAAAILAETELATTVFYKGADYPQESVDLLPLGGECAVLVTQKRLGDIQT